MNEDKFFGYDDITINKLIQSLLQIYYFMTGDISKSNLFLKFNQLDKIVSSNFKEWDFNLTKLSFSITFVIKNGGRIRQLNYKMHHLKTFASKPPNRLNFKDVNIIYNTDHDNHEIDDLESFAHGLHDAFDDPNNEPIGSPDIASLFRDIDLSGEDVQDYVDNDVEYDYGPMTSKQAEEKYGYGLKKKFIKQTVSNFKKHNKNLKHYDYLKSLIRELNK